jgi:UDP:flavonoid glycosyltransferase YjiC (YdhE family)
MAHIVAYVTGHGFGHATRMSAVIGALAERFPDLTVSLVSTAPEWLFRLNLSVPFRFRARALDVGVVQRDSIRLDAPGTLEAYAGALKRQGPLIEEEVTRLRREAVELVIADIPPAAFPIARLAGIPGVGISNFTWDWIYADYVRSHPAYGHLIEAIRDDYSRADLFLRLPFHGPCDAFPVVRDIPMVARRSGRSRQEVRRRLGLGETRPVILLSFGGFDLTGIDFGRVERLDEYLFLTTQTPPSPIKNVRAVSLDGLRYEDLVAQADAVVTKPGYGIVSDCLANQTPVLYTSRGEFAEYAPLVEGLERFGVSRFIGNEDLLAGNWREALEALLGQPRLWPDLALNGAEVAANNIAALLPDAHRDRCGTESPALRAPG